MRRNQRLRQSAEFGRVRARGLRFSDRYLILTLAASPSGRTRFGLSVVKRVGNAVTRNRIKRRLREVLTRLAIQNGWDIVISVRPHSSRATFHDLFGSLTFLAYKAGIIESVPVVDPIDSERSK